MTDRPSLLLSGCAPEPLGGYLKALGVLRLVALGPDPAVRGAWQPGGFHLISHLDEEALLRFFLDEYRPSPILAPWNGGSGFWDRQAAGKALERLQRSTSPRLSSYREAVAQAQTILQALGYRTRPKPADKPRLVRALRARLPDAALPWLDAVAVLTTDAFRPAPILGSGGNDGRLDFTANFIQHLERVVPFADEVPAAEAPRGRRQWRRVGYDRERSRAWLEDALLARGRPALVDATGGQYQPGSVGGPNATRGMEGQNLVNPWDYVLMIEGLLLFAGAAARRYGSMERARASFPFTVDTSPVGAGTAAEGEVAKARGEIWIPLWDQPATYPAVQHLLAEGRAQTGRRQARTGVDFARAVAGLGVDRGIRAFYRYGLLARNGKAYLAAPLGRLEVRLRPHIHLIDELDPWLEAWRRLIRGGQAPARFTRALREMETAIYRYCADGSPRALQEVLAAVGRAERVLALSSRKSGRPWPLHDLSTGWVHGCNDGSAEFRIAAAVAALWDEAVGPLRFQLEPVEGRHRMRWVGDATAVVWGSGNLYRNLAAVLDRRLLEARRRDGKAKANRGFLAVPLADVHAFLMGQVDEERIADLIWGLMTLRWGDRPNAGPGRTLAGPAAAAPSGAVPAAVQPATATPPGLSRTLADPLPPTPPDLSRAYALLKLTFWPDKLKLAPNARYRVPPDPSILHRLLVGDLAAALHQAGRRLWAHDLVPLGYRRGSRPALLDYAEPPTGTMGLAAALLIPVSSPRRLAGMVLHLPEKESSAKGVDAV